MNRNLRNIINVTFDQSSLLNKCINFWPQTYERLHCILPFSRPQVQSYLTKYYSNVINEYLTFLQLHQHLFTHLLHCTAGVVWAISVIISKTALLTLCQLIPTGGEHLPPISASPKNLFSCKTLICRPIVRTPIPVLILPDPLSVKKYKSENCRRCCKRVVSANCQINKSEHMIIHNIVRRAGAQLMRPDTVSD